MDMTLWIFIAGASGLLLGALGVWLWWRSTAARLRQAGEEWRRQWQDEQLSRARSEAQAQRVPELEQKIATLVAELGQEQVRSGTLNAQMQAQSEAHQQQLLACAA